MTIYPGMPGNMATPQLHAQAGLSTATTINFNQVSLIGGTFPCGLIQVNVGGVVDPGTLELGIRLVPGMNRGYLTQSMQDM